MASTGSLKFAKVNQMITGLGAAVVIVGAMFKINHWTGATEMLIVGLSTEAIIFSISAFLPIHEEPNWSLVYPELAGEPGEKEDQILEQKEDQEAITQRLNNVLKNFDPNVLVGLESGIKSLNTSVSGLADMTDASVATDEYAKKVKQASGSLSQLNTSYEKAVDAVSSLSNVSSSAGKYQEQVQEITKNLSQLNSIYEVELNEANQYYSNIKKFYGSINEAMTNLNDMAVHTTGNKNQLDELSKNLTSVNSMYTKMGKMMSDTSEIASQSEQIKQNFSTLNQDLTVRTSENKAQLDELAKNLSSVNSMFSNMNKMMTSLTDIASQSEEYKKHFSSLNKNLSALNSVYGGMLSAMGRNS